MNITNAELNDADKIIALYTKVANAMQASPFTAYWKMGVHPTEKGLLDAINTETMYVLKDDNAKIIGTMILNNDDTVGYNEAKWLIDVPKSKVMILHLLAIDPDMRGKGCAEMMMRYAFKIAKTKHALSFRLDAIKTNIPTQKLYQKCGMTIVGETEEKIETGDIIPFVIYEKPILD